MYLRPLMGRVVIWIAFILLLGSGVSVIAYSVGSKSVAGRVARPEALVTADSISMASFVTGRFDYKLNADFIQLSTRHAVKPFYLQKEVFSAYLRMYEAALQDGVQLKIVSATRSFDEQRHIWEWKWGEQHRKGLQDSLTIARNILEYSLMPGTSRHHWGTEIDINNINQSYFETATGKRVYNWLLEHAPEYGFCQVYTEKGTGVKPEPWHWSYMPLSETYLQWYNSFIDYAQIAGFTGAEQACHLSVLESYVNGIRPACE
jgi:D-alanyl-D-alanine carboxypeptidase